MKVLHIITGLSIGGAELMLLKLVSAMSRSDFDPYVISLVSGGPVAGMIRDQGIPVVELGISRSLPNPIMFWHLIRLIRRIDPDVVQTWMYHADFLGGLATKFSGQRPLIWNIRQSNFDPEASKGRTRRLAGLCAMLSRVLPVKIVSCSEVASNVHVKIGYCESKMTIIPNGFDVNVRSGDSSARRSVREELHVPEDTILIGKVARFDRQKDHRTFIRAVAQIARGHPTAHFVLCGEGIDSQNTDLMEWIAETGIGDRIHLLGLRQDIMRLNSAFDIATSSSAFGEGFPNVLGEAMLCSVPCVATDVGDSSLIVGDTGKIVPPRDVDAFAAACMGILSLDDESRRTLGALARQRIEEKFSIATIGAQFAALYREVAD